MLLGVAEHCIAYEGEESTAERPASGGASHQIWRGRIAEGRLFRRCQAAMRPSFYARRSPRGWTDDTGLQGKAVWSLLLEGAVRSGLPESAGIFPVFAVCAGRRLEPERFERPACCFAPPLLIFELPFEPTGIIEATLFKGTLIRTQPRVGWADHAGHGRRHFVETDTKGGKAVVSFWVRRPGSNLPKGDGRALGRAHAEIEVRVAGAVKICDLGTRGARDRSRDVIAGRRSAPSSLLERDYTAIASGLIVDVEIANGLHIFCARHQVAHVAGWLRAAGGTFQPRDQPKSTNMLTRCNARRLPTLCDDYLGESSLGSYLLACSWPPTCPNRPSRRRQRGRPGVVDCARLFRR